MKKIIHISDIHFGKVDYVAVDALIKEINAAEPDLTVISGDLTQRARSAQFVEAKEFLDRLPLPQLVIPGNHDVPLYNVYQRFFAPLDKYKKYITEDLSPYFIDDEIAVVGVNSARSFTFKDGSVSRAQAAEIKEKLCPLDNKILKIVVTHHPFDLPEGHEHDSDLIDNAERTMEIISDCGADVFLAGHLHLSFISESATRYKMPDGRSALIIQAGTATSTRKRGETNSFNILHFEHPHLRVEKFDWIEQESRFALAATREFIHREEGGWSHDVINDDAPTINHQTIEKNLEEDNKAAEE